MDSEGSDLRERAWDAAARVADRNPASAGSDLRERAWDAAAQVADRNPALAGSDLRERAWDAAAEVVDPEIPVLTILDLGVLRDVVVRADGGVDVAITPTYSGCPAMGVIAIEVELALARAGISGGHVRQVLSPAWTTDWLTGEGRRKLAAYGIAPPPTGPAAGRRALFGDAPLIACPRCASTDTERLAEFGSTSCKALWRCRACAEPFDVFKCH